MTYLGEFAMINIGKQGGVEGTEVHAGASVRNKEGGMDVVFDNGIGFTVEPEELADKELCCDGRYACFYCANSHNFGGIGDGCQCQCHEIHTHSYQPSLSPQYETCAFCGDVRRVEEI